MMQSWVIGNWKQNPATINDVNTLLDSLITALLNHKTTSTATCQLMIAPSCVHLAAASLQVRDTAILCAAQDISAYSADIGAYTGDCSAQQIADAGATWTILGHSERRQYHQESNDTLSDKIKHAFAQNLGVILCVGETQTQYDAKQTFAVLDQQLAVIKSLAEQQAPKAELADSLIIAYEPVWAIGTGKVPTVDEVDATHAHIKQTLASFDTNLSEVAVLYGGSVNADNAESFAASPMINGALVGGAALKSESFMAIAAAFSASKR